jgi:hypothetical protein
MDNDTLFETSVIEKLVNLNSDLAGKRSCVAWTTFPYNKENLKIVEISIRKLNWNKEDYSIDHDENLIFVKKDMV